MTYSTPELAAALVGVVAALVTLVGIVVRWFVSRATAAAEADRARIAALEERVRVLEVENDQHRHDKHAAMGESAAYLGTLRVIRKLHDSLSPPQLYETLPRLLDVIPDRRA